MSVFITTNPVSSSFEIHKAFTSSGIYPAGNLTRHLVIITHIVGKQEQLKDIFSLIVELIMVSQRGLAFKTKNPDSSITTTSTTKMVLDANGNVGIGITNPDSKLSVKGDNGQNNAGHNGVLQIMCGSSGKHVDGMCIRAYYDNYNIINFTNSSGDHRGKIDGVNSSSVSYVTTSDRRRKENIREMESMIDKVMAMKCRQFNWIEGKEEDYGFIAQEIYEIFPHERPDISGYCKYKCCDEEEDDDEETLLLLF